MISLRSVREINLLDTCVTHHNHDYNQPMHRQKLHNCPSSVQVNSWKLYTYKSACNSTTVRMAYHCVPLGARKTSRVNPEIELLKASSELFLAIFGIRQKNHFVGRTINF